jgi:hypothetical protein
MDQTSQTILWIGLALLAVSIFAPIVSYANRKSKANSKIREHEQTHNRNLSYLHQVGFQIQDQYHPKESAIYLYFDYTNKNAALEYFIPGTICSNITLFPLNRIVECDLVQNGSVISREEGKMGGAVILGYGAMAGNKQAVSEEMGGVLAVRLVIDDMRVPAVVVNVLETAISKASQEYQKFFFIAQEIYGRFQGVVRINNAEMQKLAQQQTPKAAQLPENIMDQIRKLGQLRDDGILTEQEFDSKKKLLMEKIQ